MIVSPSLNAQIMAYPKDPDDASDSPRWHSAKYAALLRRRSPSRGLGMNVIKLLMVNILVYSCVSRP